MSQRLITLRLMNPIPLTREAWLLFAINHLAPIFAEAGYTVPRVRVSCAVPATSKRGNAVGLQGKMREASAGPQLKARLEKIAAVLIAEIGPYPHAKLMVGGAIYEQARKPARAECPHCNFKISMLRQYLDVGPPICPKDLVPMERRGDWEKG